MSKKREYTRYELKDGKKVVYRGITNDPSRRETEHRSDGKKFSRMTTVGPRVTEETARKWEKGSIKTYQKGHKGKKPKYNK